MAAAAATTTITTAKSWKSLIVTLECKHDTNKKKRAHESQLPAIEIQNIFHKGARGTNGKQPAIFVIANKTTTKNNRP